MSDDNPGSFDNVTDAELQDGKACYDTQQQKLIGNQRLNYELLVGGAGYAGESRQIYPHTHGDLNESTLDGLTKRRTIFSNSFANGSYAYATWTGVATASWDELFRFRCCVGPFQRLAAEVRYLVSANGVKFRLERWDWADSGSATDDGGTKGTQYLEESANNTATSATWTTLDGVSYTSDGAGGYNANNGGAATKLLYVDVTSYTNLDEACALAEFRLLAQASAASTDLSLYNFDLFEVLKTDEGGSGWLD